jgi:dynein light chain Tctex-type 1
VSAVVLPYPTLSLPPLHRRAISLSPSSFLVEDIEVITKNALQTIFTADAQYDPERVSQWTNSTIELILKGLHAAGKPFKYAVTCIITQKNGAGMHTAAGASWDPKKDGACHAPRCCSRHAPRPQLSRALKSLPPQAFAKSPGRPPPCSLLSQFLALLSRLHRKEAMKRAIEASNPSSSLPLSLLIYQNI